MRLLQRAKNIYHFLQAQAWRLYFGRPDTALTLLGVTGTNGKTTTCYLLDSMLAHEFGRARVGMMTTVAVRTGEQLVANTTKLTTLPSRAVYRRLRDMHRAGVRQVVLELSSHALDQGRLAGITLAGAIVLNLEREHLDYHGTLAEYGRAKGKIARMLKAGAPLVVREDTIGKLHITNDRLQSLHVITFTAAQAEAVRTPLPGGWNRENVLAATLLARAYGIGPDAVAAGVAAVRHVPGRVEWIERAGRPRVIIDYAVTPDALRRLYAYVRSQESGKLYAVLGAAGLRDRGKRPGMARAAAELADEVVLTREDPWTESENQIFADLERGLVDSTVAWRRIVDRREAIRYCLAQAQAHDVVVVTGKGAEQGMAVGREIVPWNDRKVIEELLEEREE
jgi:UDP-N-acetylmuramyl tripeptide synthase